MSPTELKEKQLLRQLPNEFITFMKDEKVWDKYKENVYVHAKKVGADTLLKIILNEDKHILNVSFEWKQTKDRGEGFEFWKKIYDKWLTYIEKNRQPD